MTIVLTNGKIIRPGGRWRLESYGICMMYGDTEHIIPFTQISHIFQGSDFQEEERIYDLIRQKEQPKPVPSLWEMSTNDLVKQLYK